MIVGKAWIRAVEKSMAANKWFNVSMDKFFPKSSFPGHFRKPVFHELPKKGD